MGSCCSSRYSDKGETVDLRQLLDLNHSDFVKLGRRSEMESKFDILNSDMQSHTNVFCTFVNDRRT